MVRIPLEIEGTKIEDEEKKDSSIQVENGERIKRFEVSKVFECSE